MPAAPAPGAPAVQVFGRRDSRETQKALRFFKERRVAVSFVDLAVRPLAVTELRRFIERLGAETLIDRDGRPYREQGVGYLRMDTDEVADRLQRDQSLVRLPLVRAGSRFSVGVDERAWRTWLAADTRAAETGASVSTARSRTS